MQLFDLHTHTNMSDAQFSLEELVRTEEAQGHILGVSDHFFCCGIYTLSQVQSYLDALTPYRVYHGAEVNMEHDFSLPDALEDRLDYVIASVHNMPDGRGGFVPLSAYFCKRSNFSSTYSKNYAPDMSRYYLAYILRMVEKTFDTQRVDIYGHSTVLPAYDELHGTKFLLDWENAVLSLCKKYNVALEISGLWKAPNFDMIRRGKEMGLTFSMGSDCHSPLQIGDLSYVEEAIEQVGLTEEDFFRPSRSLD